MFLPAGQPAVLKLLRRPICGFSPRRSNTIHGLTSNLARRKALRRARRKAFRRAKFHVAREYL